jgi:potassium-dependent mechanosensitive channel
MAEVATRAAQVPNLLRALTEPLAAQAEIETIRKDLHEAREQMDLELAAGELLLRTQPTLDVIQSQQQLWQRRQFQASGWLSVLTQRATQLQDALNHLAETRTTWRQTRRAAVSSNAPAAILVQIDEALAAIEAAETPLVVQRTAVLDLQSVVAHEVTRSATALAQFTQAQQRAMGGILTRDGPPVWEAQAWATARGTLRTRVGEVAAARWADIVGYARDPSSGIALHTVLLLALGGVFLAARRQVRRSEASGADEPLGITVFDRPYAAALTVTLLVVSAPISAVPQSLRSLSAMLMLVPVLRLTRPAIDPRLLLPVYSLVVLFMLDSLRETIGGAPVLDQAILALEMVSGMAVLTYALTLGAFRRVSVAGAETEWLRAFRVGSGLVVLVLGVALATGAVGYMRLARLLASGLFAGGALALTLYACVRVLTGVAAFGLRIWPLRLLRMVQHHRELLEHRAARVLLWCAIGAWTSRVLDHAGLFQPAWSLTQAMLAAKLGRGSISFSAADALEFTLTLAAAYLISAFIRFVLREDVYPRTRMTRGMSYAVSSLLNYVILTLGFLLALGTLGLDLTKVTVLAGAFGIGLGFGLQSIVNNFVSGLILLFERPIHVGDVIEMGDLLGEVSRIGIRASTVRTYRGADIIVPNAQLVTDRVTNWTLSDRRRRIDVPVGVDYGSAPEKVVEVLEAVARGHPLVLKEPPPQALFMAFADSAINFELRAWTNQFERWPKIQTELAAGVYAALRGAGMSLPFPQREVRVVGARGGAYDLQPIAAPRAACDDPPRGREAT